MLTGFYDFDRTFRALEEFRRRMDQVFEEFDVRPDLARATPGPLANLWDNGQSFVLQAELPGVSEKDVELSVHQNVVTLRGERKADAPEGYAVHRQERTPFKFTRSLELPMPIDPDKVSAELKDGVLTLTLPKAAEAQPKQITVKAH